MRKMSKVSSKSDKPKLLLHCCCAPCASAVIEILEKDFELTLFFFNPNIMPREEYDRRLSELQRLNLESKRNLEIVIGEYSNDKFLEIARGLEVQKEGGARCEACISMRLLETANIALKMGFDVFATTLSISPHKNAQYINDVGSRLETELGIKYLVSDFKKKNGYLRSIQLSRQFGLYRQKYCGCIFEVGE